MAGVVTMASVIEDFETQPCKKSGKDSGSPVVKTITNYFSPVPKPAEKPFSPPRSNNIMDYFSRKTSLSKDQDRSPEQCNNKNDQTSQLADKDIGREPGPNHLPQKRKKASRAARKLVESENARCSSEESSLIKEEQHESRNSAARPKNSCGILGSDTAALLVRISAEACLSTETLERNATKAASLDQSERDENGKDDRPKHVKTKPEIKDTELSSIVPLKEKSKQSRVAARSSRKVQQQRAKDAEQEEKEGSLCDVAMEVSEEKASKFNSMVTVSFEDFLQSQSQDAVREDITNEHIIEEDSIKITSEDEMDTDPMEIPKAEENAVSVEPPLQVSPRTLTIQAEVHAVSLKQNTAKGNAKLASIFNRRKGTINSAVLTSPCQTEAQQQLPAASLAVKRKSNVVLQEEDLELAVLDSESAPKCSEVERKQFMAAFKQPSMDGSKIKPFKSQSKQKQGGENVSEQVEKVSENPVPVDQEPAASQEHKAVKRKPARKDKKTVDEEKEAASSQPVAPVAPEASAPNLDPNPDPTIGKVISVVKVNDKDEESPITSAPSTPAVRRSKREAVVRQTPEAALTTPVRKTRKHESKDAAAVLPDPSPAFTSTTKRRRSKHGLFVAEITCPPDTKQSPIRMKFTRIHKNVSVAEAQSGSGLNTPVDHKVSTDTQKRKRVKKLVEKAKVIQHGKKTDVTLRRSSRAEANAKKNFCEDEDSVICVDDDVETTAPKVTSEKLKIRKSLRSLNDVLGKTAPADKEARALTGSKMSSPVIEKPVRKVSAIISIFDDSSHDGSDSMQDDEQFRARRDFLKSGLPESFRKQIAKTAASKEAYSLSCSSFQLVVHIKQQPNDCPLWSLPWPESLGHLKASWSQTCGRLPPVCGPVCVKTEPTRTAFSEQGSGWRPGISESVRQQLLEEVRASNPSFPVQMFMSRFLKRRSDPQQQQSSASEPGIETRVQNSSLPPESVGGKRKRRDDEEEMTGKVAKKQRPTSSEISTPEPKRGGGRTRRGQRSSQEEGQTEKNKPSDVLKEDMLWTDKYQPQSSTDVIGNPASVRRLHSWLKEWKARVDQEERKKQKEKKQEEGSNDSDWDCGEDDFQDGEDILCNTMLITGPSGVGKTAAVYACAQELGFKVFEVNASSQRSGRLILSQLKEATQSHQVDSQGVNAHKPTYFNCYSTSSSAGSMRPGSSPRKTNSPRLVVSSPRKYPQSPRGAKRGLAPTSLANFFKGSQNTNRDTQSTKKNEQTAVLKKATKKTHDAKNSKDSAVKSSTVTTLKERANEEQSRRTATSLILFEEVDVIFDDDSGFLSAIKTFMTTTKRPVILTTSDPSFSTMFDGIFEEIIFQTPSMVDVSSFLRLLCLTEDVRTDQADVSSLLRLNGCDIRQSLLQLQLWTRSGGGRRFTHTGGDDEDVAFPPCDLGCAQSMLGLLNIEPERDMWELFKSQSLLEGESSLELLTSCRRRGVDLLYSNMEMLLPLPRTQLTSSTFKPGLPVSTSQDHPSDTLPSYAGICTAESADSQDDTSPVKMSNRMRKNKRQHSLPEQDESHSDSEETFLTLKRSQRSPPAIKEHTESFVSEKVRRTSLTPEERVKSLPVSQCLNSIAVFLEDMSYSDSFLLEESKGRDCGQRRFGAAIKDGMNDEPRVEMDKGSRVRRELVSEIAAAVEALSFNRCQVSVAETWDKAQKVEGELGKELAVELRLPLAAHREGYSLSEDAQCHPQLVQQRSEVLESLTVKGAFGFLGNKTAAALDYLPAVRTICRSEQLKEQGKVKRRFLHYLDAISLGLEKGTLQHLAKDFP